MANTSSITGSLQVTNALSGIIASDPFSSTLSSSGSHVVANVQDFANSAFVNVNIGSIATLKLLYLKNLDQTNSIDVTADSTTGAKIFATLAPGDPPLMCAVKSSATYACKASASTVSVAVIAVEA